MILVNFSGSAIGLVPESGICNAILQAWYPGQEGGTAGPVKTLRGYKRMLIPAGKTVFVEFELNDETFEWWSERERKMVPLPGEYEVMVGSSSDDADLQTSTVNW